MELETYEIVSNEENSDIEPSIVENNSINNNTAHIDKTLVLTCVTFFGTFISGLL